MSSVVPTITPTIADAITTTIVDGAQTLRAIAGFTSGLNCVGGNDFAINYTKAANYADFTGVSFAALAKLAAEQLPDPTFNEVCGTDSWACASTAISGGIATLAILGSVEVTANQPTLNPAQSYTVEIVATRVTGGSTDIRVGGDNIPTVLSVGTNTLTGITGAQIGAGAIRIANVFGGDNGSLILAKFSLKQEVAERTNNALSAVPLELNPDVNFAGACGDGTWTCVNGAQPTTIVGGVASIGLVGSLTMSGNAPTLNPASIYDVVIDFIQVTGGTLGIRLGGNQRVVVPVVGINTFAGFTGAEIGAATISLAALFGGAFVTTNLNSWSIRARITNNAINYGQVTFTPPLAAEDVIEFRYDSGTGNHTDADTGDALEDQTLTLTNCLTPALLTTHPNEVVSYLVGKRYTRQLVGRTLGIPVAELLNFASFTTNPGDHILFIHSAVNVQSGNKLASDLSSAGTLPNLATAQFHVSSHSMVLGDNANNLRNSTGSNTGFDHFCTIGYFDRENGLTRVCSSLIDVIDPYDGSVFGGIRRATTVAGTDAGLGSISPSLNLRGYEELNGTRVIIWPAGTAPPLDVIEDAMRNMWDDWVTNNNPILDAQLFNYA